MPRPPRTEPSREARGRLLALAKAEFADKGFDGASLNAILEEARTSKGVFYYYFEHKEDLFAAVIEREIDELLAAHPVPSFEGVAPGNFWDTATEVLSVWAGAVTRSSDLASLVRQVTAARKRSPKFAPILAKGQRILRQVIEAGQRMGRVRTDLPIDALVRLVAAADHALDERFLADGELSTASLQDHVHLLVDTYRRLIAVDPPEVQ